MRLFCAQRYFTPLHYAVVKDNVDVVVLLHEDIVHHVDVLDEQLFSVNEHRIMSLAIMNGAYECIKKFVYWGANCNEKDSQENTYLHMAAMSGHVNIFLYFLSKQVSYQSKNAQDLTAADLAKKYKHFHLIEYLREKFDANNSVLNRQDETITGANH